jgi:hypothetical protein
VVGEATYLVECFWPDLRREQVDAAADRASASADELTREGRRVGFAGSILIAADEVVFYLFDCASPDDAREACERARIPYERIVESALRTQAPAERGEAWDA